MDFESIASAYSANPARVKSRLINDAYIIPQKSQSARGRFENFVFFFTFFLSSLAFSDFSSFRLRVVRRVAPPSKETPKVRSPSPTRSTQTSARAQTARRAFNQPSRKEKTSTKQTSRQGLIPDPGVEPGRPCGQWILNPSRLPIPPIRRAKNELFFNLPVQLTLTF